MNNKDIRIIYNGTCYGPLNSKHLDIKSLMKCLEIPDSKLHNLVIRKIDSNRDTIHRNIINDSILSPGLYDIQVVDETKVKQNNPFQVKQIIESEQSALEPSLSLLDYISDNIAHLSDRILSPKSIQQKKAEFHDLKEQLIHIKHILDTCPILQNISNLKLVARKEGLLSIVTVLLSNIHAYGLPTIKRHEANHNGNTHESNIFHLKRRIQDQNLPREKRKSPIQNYLINPVYLFRRVEIPDKQLKLPKNNNKQVKYIVDTLRLFKSHGIELDQPDKDVTKVQLLDTRKTLSQFRIKLVDSIIESGITKTEDIRKLVDALLSIEVERVSGYAGSSECHGSYHLYPAEEIRTKIFSDFQLN